jgi:DNA-binding transcriptional LysR family regulator
MSHGMQTRLTHLDAFVAAADEGSFSAAARRLGITPAAVSKSVARLEEPVSACACSSAARAA